MADVDGDAPYLRAESADGIQAGVDVDVFDLLETAFGRRFANGRQIDRQTNARLRCLDRLTNERFTMIGPGIAL